MLSVLQRATVVDADADMHPSLRPGLKNVFGDDEVATLGPRDPVMYKHGGYYYLAL